MDGDAMGYDVDAYFRPEYAEIERVPGWENGYPDHDKADLVATLERGSGSTLAPELFRSLNAEEFDGKVSGNAGSRFFTRPQIIDAVRYIAEKLPEQPFLDRELDFLARILLRMNTADSPEHAVVWIWFC